MPYIVVVVVVVVVVTVVVTVVVIVVVNILLNSALLGEAIQCTRKGAGVKKGTNSPL